MPDSAFSLAAQMLQFFESVRLSRTSGFDPKQGLGFSKIFRLRRLIHGVSERLSTRQRARRGIPTRPRRRGKFRRPRRVRRVLRSRLRGAKQPELWSGGRPARVRTTRLRPAAVRATGIWPAALQPAGIRAALRPARLRAAGVRARAVRAAELRPWPDRKLRRPARRGGPLRPAGIRRAGFRKVWRPGPWLWFRVRPGHTGFRRRIRVWREGAVR